MASWLNPCSSARRALPPIDIERPAVPRWSALLWLVFLSAGCGRAAVPAGPAAIAGAAAEPATVATPAAAPGTAASGAQALCSPATAGRIEAKLQGAIDAEIRWSAGDHTQCLGAPRPGGDGIRLLYKGEVAGAPLLVVIGVGGIARGASGRNLPVNMTLIREGTGVFYATQGDDKCALDSLQQVPLDRSSTRFRLTGRGYCMQPARGVAADGAVLVSRFDVEALVEFPVANAE